MSFFLMLSPLSGFGVLLLNYVPTALSPHSVWDTLDFDHSDLYIISLCREPITAVGCENATVCVNISTGNQAYALGTPDTCKVEYNPTSKTLQFSFEYENVRPFRDSYVNVSLICGSRAVSTP